MSNLLTICKKICLTQFTHILLSDCSCEHTCDCLPSTTSSSSCIISDTILEMVGKICMIWTENIFEVVVILAMSIGIADHDSDRMPRSISLKHPRQDFKVFIILSPGRGEGTLSCLSSCHLETNIFSVYLKSCRKSVNHNTQCWSMRFSKCRNT